MINKLKQGRDFGELARPAVRIRPPRNVVGVAIIPRQQAGQGDYGFDTSLERKRRESANNRNRHHRYPHASHGARSMMRKIIKILIKHECLKGADKAIRDHKESSRVLRGEIEKLSQQLKAQREDV